MPSTGVGLVVVFRVVLVAPILVLLQLSLIVKRQVASVTGVHDVPFKKWWVRLFRPHDSSMPDAEGKRKLLRLDLGELDEAGVKTNPDVALGLDCDVLLGHALQNAADLARSACPESLDELVVQLGTHLVVHVELVADDLL
jgi:hypothetical protein